jgi:LmbE family N-acetylglucosaminyl deacetylase
MKTVLVIGAHADDEVLGCGGTMARLAAEGAEVHVLLLADGETSRAGAGDAHKAARNRAAEEAAAILGCKSTVALDFPDNRLDSVDLLDIVQVIEARIDALKPDTVFTHHNGDVNIDHRRVHEAVLAACRPQPGHCVRQLLFYEVASSTEWRPPNSGAPFLPNTFFDISGALDAKRAALDAYAAEMRPFPHARSIEAVEALARWRGATVGVAAAEAFMLGRAII